MARNYRLEYDNYGGTPEQIKKRAQRVKARRMMEKAGRVHKGDGKDVDHATPISKGGSTTMGNLRAVPKSQNRSFPRTRTGAMKGRKA